MNRCMFARSCLLSARAVQALRTNSSVLRSDSRMRVTCSRSSDQVQHFQRACNVCRRPRRVVASTLELRSACCSRGAPAALPPPPAAMTDAQPASSPGGGDSRSGDRPLATR